MLFIVISAVVGFAVYSVRDQDMRDFAQSMEKDWNVAIPEKASLKFAHLEPKGFHGDRKQYAVFQLEDGLPEPEVRNRYQSQKNTDVETDIRNILSAINAPAEELPPFSRQYFCVSIVHPGKYGDDILYILYFPETKESYYIEKIIGSS